MDKKKLKINTRNYEYTPQMLAWKHKRNKVPSAFTAVWTYKDHPTHTPIWHSSF